MKAEKYSILDRMIIPDYDTPSGVKSGEMTFDTDKCTQCGICIAICPGGCIYTDQVTKKELNSDNPPKGKHGMPKLAKTYRGATLCVACFDCGAACPAGAISVKSHWNPGRYFKRLTQTDDMIYPVRY